MKKKFIVFLCLFALSPLNALAYSNEVILGGKTIGIDIKAEGIMVIGFYKVEGSLPKTSLKEGDIILKIGNEEVNSINELTKAIENNMDDNNTVEITYKRDKNEKTTTLKLVKQDGMYKTGLYVKDSITGIGTLTFIDPESNIYGALGHEITESNTSKIIEVRTGTIFKNSISSITESIDGKPGSKNAKFYSSTIYGNIEKNSETGIYGKYTIEVPDKKALKVATIEEIEEGNAKIYTVLEGDTLEEFDIEITKVDEKSDIKNIYFKVTDKKLLEKTGGIVQGMSGSPIIQNDKIIGAVTHVVISNPSSGYGISIINMLEEGERQN